jgi:hypothetical protein
MEKDGGTAEEEMRAPKFEKFGPFTYFRVKNRHKNFLSMWLTGYGDAPFGWEWGHHGEGSDPSFCVRVGHFDIVSYEGFDSGFIMRFLGFWWVR